MVHPDNGDAPLLNKVTNIHGPSIFSCVGQFQVHGHAKVSVLNGGFEKWTELGFPTTSEVPVFNVNIFIQ